MRFFAPPRGFLPLPRPAEKKAAPHIPGEGTVWVQEPWLVGWTISGSPAAINIQKYLTKKYQRANVSGNLTCGLDWPSLSPPPLQCNAINGANELRCKPVNLGALYQILLPLHFYVAKPLKCAHCSTSMQAVNPNGLQIGWDRLGSGWNWGDKPGLGLLPTFTISVFERFLVGNLNLLIESLRKELSSRVWSWIVENWWTNLATPRFDIHIIQILWEVQRAWRESVTSMPGVTEANDWQ